ncbi:MAG: 5'/3'-nucleotidase SurE [Bacteroidetes bacterium]|nr:5'/3'-nucleotidase SurE [Bacteroidota bacterium]MBL6944321.1 5'/3'-nucleotidase SurE [Bacteroidales bacterium]
MTKKPLILITNDDGINAPGLRKLISLVKHLGEIIVIASEHPMSGMAHAVTIQNPLRVRLLTEETDYKEYLTTGTPVDNVKLGKHKLASRLPDLILSGINHGSNAAVNIIYSGTMGAVLEGAIDRVPGIGFSLDDFSPHADFSHVDVYVIAITKKVLREGLPKGVCLNVNFPLNSSEPLKGIKVCRQADARWIEEFEERQDPHGRTYYWLAGRFENGDDRNDTDEKALADNYVSVVPSHTDFTAHDYVNKLDFSL